MRNGELRYFSTFSGIGGFELGIERAVGVELSNEISEPAQPEIQLGRERATVEEERGVLSSDIGERRSVRCVGYAEIDKYAVQIYQSHFPDHTNYGDITKIQAEDLPDFDLFVGGFPCQAFSVAGLRRGFEDTRGTLFFEIARICSVKRPRLLLLENVKGLLSHDQGDTFRTIIHTLDELGYDLQWQVLNSKDFGVPQNRERVFIVGHLRGTPRPEVFPFGEDDGVNLEQDAQGYAHCLQGGNDKHRGTYVAVDTRQIRDGVRIYEDFAPTISARDWKGGNQVMKDAVIRRLTPTECERLQGFPDGWTEGVSDTQRYKCLGNAVTVNVIEAVVGRMIQ